MSIVKSFSVGHGDMFYIKHKSSSFSVIDCCLDDDNKEEIIEEIKVQSKSKDIRRFISTHPDDDHLRGIDFLDENWSLINFYCVENKAIKEKETDSFKKYCKLRDSDNAFYVYKGCRRAWLNRSNDINGSSGLNIKWPDIENKDFIEELEKAKNGEGPNNISMIVQYNCNAKFLWMGDIQKEFLEKVENEIDFEEVDIVFAPHHGRKSSKIPSHILKKLNPKIIIIGEAPSENLGYDYPGYNKITQSSAGDITFEVKENLINIYVGNSNYSVTYLENKDKDSFDNYIGSLEIK